MLKNQRSRIVFIVTAVLMAAALIISVVWAVGSVKDGIDEARKEIKVEQENGNNTGGSTAGDNGNGGDSTLDPDASTGGSIGMDIPTDPIEPLKLMTIQKPGGFAKYTVSGDPIYGIQYKVHVPEEDKARYDRAKDQGRTINYKLLFATSEAYKTVSEEWSIADEDWVKAFEASTQKNNYIEVPLDSMVYIPDSGNGYGAYWELTFNRNFSKAEDLSLVCTKFYALAFVECYDNSYLSWREFSYYDSGQYEWGSYSMTFGMAAADSLNQNAVYRRENGDYLYGNDLEEELKGLVSAASYYAATHSYWGVEEDGKWGEGWKDWFPTVSFSSLSLETTIGSSVTIEYNNDLVDERFYGVAVPVMYMCDVRDCFTYKDLVVTGYRTCTEIPLYIYIFGGEHVIYVTIK